MILLLENNLEKIDNLIKELKEKLMYNNFIINTKV